MREFDSLTRRQAMNLLGVGAGLGVLTAMRDHAAAAAGAPALEQAAFPRGAIIRTVREDVPVDRMNGITLFHEHLSLRSKFYDDLDLMAAEVKACKADGVGCIVDAGTVDLGRKIESLRAIADRSGMRIVAGGGFHIESDYPPDTARKSDTQIADDFEALAKAERWGVIGEIGTGTDVPIHPEEKKVLRAAAKLQARTGLSIITHNSDGCPRCVLEQVDVFEAAGARLNQLVVGHLNEVKDDLAGLAITVAKRGAYLGFDHMGKPDDPRAGDYTRAIMAILEAGYGDRLCLSSDFGSAKYLRKNGGPGIDMTVTQAVPQLKKAGIDEATLHKILVDNPRHAIAFVPKG